MENRQENRMGTEKVSSLLMKMGMPIVLSMMLQAMYNIIDSMFVARMPDMNGIEHTGEMAVNALTLAFPVQMLFVAFGIGTGVGVGAMLSRQLGQNDREGVARTAGNGVTLSLIMYAIFVLFGLFGMDPYLKSQTSDPVILNMAHQYLAICTFLSIANIMWGIYEKLLQSTGRTPALDCCADHRCADEHSARSDHDLRPARLSDDGCCRSSGSNSHRTVCNDDNRDVFPVQEKQRDPCGMEISQA